MGGARAGGHLSGPARVFIFTLAYALLAQLSYAASYFPAGALAVWWAPSGLAVASLVRADRKLLPWFLFGIVLAAGLVNAAQPIGPLDVAYRVFADLAEPLVAATLLRRRFGQALRLETLREVLNFTAVGGLLGPGVGSSVVFAGMWLTTGSAQEAGRFAALWFGSAALGAMLFGPVFLTWRRPLQLPRGPRLVEASLLAAVLCGVSVGAIFVPTGSPLTTLIGFMAFPPLVWAAGRFGPSGASRAAVALSLLSLWPVLTARVYLDPWQLILSQGIYAIGVVTALSLSALTAETQRLRARAEAHARRAEESLALLEKAYREARAAVQVREDFLSIASHELKTPLTPLAARLSYVKKKLEAGEPIQPESMDKPLRSLRKLTELINDLLDASRIEHGRLLLQRHPVPLDEVVRQSVEPFRGISPRHHLTIETPSEPVWVDADPQRLGQMITNLVDNAIKYSPSGGEVEVRVRPHPEGVEVVVSDQGIGIPREQLDRLFERFYRAGNASVSYGGLGLGLYITRDIVDRHGGRIWAESEPGQRSTFHVVLPRIQHAELQEALH